MSEGYGQNGKVAITFGETHAARPRDGIHLFVGIKSLENLGEARVLSQVPTAEHGQARVLTELSSYQFDFRPRPPAKSPDSVCFLTNRQAGRQHALAQHGRQEAEKVGRFHERRVQAEVHGAQGQGQGRHHGRRGVCATQGGGSPDPAVLCGGLRGSFQEQPGPQLTHELLPRQHTWQHRVGNAPCRRWQRHRVV